MSQVSTAEALKAAIDENVELSAECESLAERVGHLELENLLLRRQLNAASIDAGAPLRLAFVEGRLGYPQVVGRLRPCL